MKNKMNLIIIQGIPGVGKYTVAKELSKKTKYKLLHNHTIIDLASSILEKNEDFWEFCWDTRIKILKKAQKQKVKGIIMTMAFQGSQREEKNIKKIIKNIEKEGGKTFFVHLTCEEKELQKRIINPERKKFGKLTTKNKLKEWLKNYEEPKFFKQKKLLLDITKLSPRISTNKIIEFLKK